MKQSLRNRTVGTKVSDEGKPVTSMIGFCQGKAGIYPWETEIPLHF